MYVQYVVVNGSSVQCFRVLGLQQHLSGNCCIKWSGKQHQVSSGSFQAPYTPLPCVTPLCHSQVAPSSNVSAVNSYTVLMEDFSHLMATLYWGRVMVKSSTYGRS